MRAIEMLPGAHSFAEAPHVESCGMYESLHGLGSDDFRWVCDWLPSSHVICWGTGKEGDGWRTSIEHP